MKWENPKNEVHGFTTTEERIGEGTPYAATLATIPDDDANGDLEWTGNILFDDDRYNWPETYGVLGAELTLMVPWFYPRSKPSGAAMAGALVTWHGEIVAFIERVKA